MPLNDPMVIGVIVYIVAMVVLFTVLFLLDRLAGWMRDQLTPPRRERLAIEARKQPQQGAPQGGRELLARGALVGLANRCRRGRWPGHR